MTHKHGGCSPAIQIIMIVFGIIAVSLSVYAIIYDMNWNIDLQAIKRSFKPEEVELLTRDNYWMEASFVLIIGSGTILILVHLIFSLKLPKNDLYGTLLSNIFHYIIIAANIVAFLLMIASISHYDQNYYKVEAQDNRTYTFKFKPTKDSEPIEIQSPYSLFHYCHLGNGKLTRPSELKGIRIRKTDSKICQHLGSKCVAALLALYIAVLAYCVLWFLSVSNRHLEGTTMSKLFDLYGDAEEFSRDHPHHPNPSKEVAEFREMEKYRAHQDEDEAEDEEFEGLYSSFTSIGTDVDGIEWSKASMLPKTASSNISKTTKIPVKP